MNALAEMPDGSDNRIEKKIADMHIRVTQAIAAIHDEKTCDYAADLARQCADEVDLIEKELGEHRDDAKGVYERLRDKIVKYKKPFIDWKGMLNNGIGMWRRKIAQEIADANARALEAARKEAKAKAEREAAKLEKKGDAELAAEARAAAANFVPPVMHKMPENKGVVDKTTWCVDISEIESKKWELIVFLVQGGPANMGAITINPGYLKKLAQLRHKEMMTWPGITVRPEYKSETRRDSRTA